MTAVVVSCVSTVGSTERLAMGKLEAVVADIVRGGKGRHDVRWRQFLAGFLASLPAMCAGMVVGWDPVDGGDGSWLPSVSLLGAVVGAAPAGWLADLLGRRLVLAGAAVPGVAGWSLLLAADWKDEVLPASLSCQQTLLVYSGRFTSGVSAGVTMVVVCMYNCEVASDRCRGSVGSLQYLMYALGLTLARALVAFTPTPWLYSTAVVIQVLATLTLLLVPESPLFLARRGRGDAAEAALVSLGAADPGVRRRRLEELVQDRPGAGTLLRVFVVVVGLMSFRQLVGARDVAALSRLVFPESWTALCPPALYLACATMLGAFLTVLCGDLVGRKALLTSSGAAMAVCHLALSVFLFVHNAHPGEDISSIAWLPVVSALTHAAAFGVGWGVLSWVVVSEVAPPSYKGAVVSAAICVNHVLALVFTRAFYGSPWTVQHPVLSLVFCCSCCVGMLFIVLYVPETRRRSLREVQALLK